MIYENLWRPTARQRTTDSVLLSPVHVHCFITTHWLSCIRFRTHGRQHSRYYNGWSHLTYYCSSNVGGSIVTRTAHCTLRCIKILSHLTINANSAAFLIYYDYLLVICIIIIIIICIIIIMVNNIIMQ